MKVGIIIPDRGDRPEFLKNCLRLIANQTHKDKYVLLVDYPPQSNSVDITRRYRKGYERLSLDAKIVGEEFDVIAFMENDDWYAPDYLEVMLQRWEDHGCPDLFGTSETIYYNLNLKKWFKSTHRQRACAMNTLIKPGLEFKWPVDDEPYTDAYLWQLPELTKRVFTPDKIISIAMKHGVGKTGGRLHTDRLERYKESDNGFLASVVDAESFEFYCQFGIES